MDRDDVPRLRVRRDPDGALRVEVEDEEERDVRATIEATRRPAQPQDPRPGPFRQVPSFGA